MDNIKNINKYMLIVLFSLFGFISIHAQCVVNAGGGGITCGTSYDVNDSNSNDATGLTWTVVSIPSGASTPIFSNANVLKPTISGLNKPGYYTFQLSKKCSNGNVVTSQMMVTSTGDVSSFSAGSDITNVFATTGTVNLQGVIPEGFNGVWRAVNIRDEKFGTIAAGNTSFGNKNAAKTSFSLIKKANHDFDPAYRLILKITSIYNQHCSYEKEIIVRFIPNTNIKLSSYNVKQCGSEVGDEKKFISLASDSPKFNSTINGTSGDPSFGTNIVMNILQQPSDGNLSFQGIEVDRIYFNIKTIGIYKFTLTITNASGTFTTQPITFEKTGVSAKNIKFLDSQNNEIKNEYSHAFSRAELFCNYVGTNTPITINFSLDPNDDETLINSEFSVIFSPSGWAPTFQLSGQGQRKRSVTVNAPVGGWKPGTYGIIFTTRIGTGGCSVRDDFFIHISDGKREDLSIEDIVVCYPGSGAVDAVVKLPKVYQEVIDNSYLKNFNGVYKISSLNRPAGASIPTTATSTIKDESTIIRNLTKPGEYEFSIKVDGRLPSNTWLIEQEYVCSNASLETTFKVIVSEQINANAGSNQKDIFCRTQTVLVGNDPGIVGIGSWEVISSPTGAIPTFNSDSSSRTLVEGLDITGEYKFRWTIKTGDCISSSDVDVIVDLDNCKPPKIITNPMISTKTKRR